MTRPGAELWLQLWAQKNATASGGRLEIRTFRAFPYRDDTTWQGETWDGLSTALQEPRNGQRNRTRAAVLVLALALAPARPPASVCRAVKDGCKMMHERSEIVC